MSARAAAALGLVASLTISAMARRNLALVPITPAKLR
jgi:hypothetical protein